MKVYFFQFGYLVRKAILVLMIVLAGLLAFKMIESNLLEPAVSTFDPIYQGDAGSKKIALTVNVFWGEEFIPKMLDIVKKK